MNPTFVTVAPSSSLRVSHLRVLSEERSPRDAITAHEVMRAKAS